MGGLVARATGGDREWAVPGRALSGSACWGVAAAPEGNQGLAEVRGEEKN